MGQATSVLSHEHGLGVVECQSGERLAVALDLGPEEGGAGRGRAVDQRRDAVAPGRAGERLDFPAGLALDLGPQARRMC
jgi:hypothetical protein